MNLPSPLETLREALLASQDFIRDTVISGRDGAAKGSLSAVADVTAADTIYGIDKISEEAICHWFERNWPKNEPVELVMEGLEGREPLTFPAGIPVGRTKWKCIMDPIDGTRVIMYDKRPAWILTGLAPQLAAATCLSDIVVAAMTEIPTTKQWRADQVSAIAGVGRAGVRAESFHMFLRTQQRLELQPSTATDFRHGFASLARFFPAGKALTAQIEEKLWEILHATESGSSPLVFDDQYISTGGQLYELLAGHDRMIGDLRPMIFERLGLTSSLVCHPYDICTELILREAGGVVGKPDGSRLDAPLDTVSPVAWVGFANPALAQLAYPALQRALGEMLA